MKIEPFKMEVTPDQSRQVQEIIFRDGGSWNSGGPVIQHEDSPFLYLENGILEKSESRSRYFFEGYGLPLITFADFMARYGGAETTQFDIMRKIVTIAEDAHENGESGLCSVLLDALANYISNNRPE